MAELLKSLLSCDLFESRSIHDNGFFLGDGVYRDGIKVLLSCEKFVPL